MKLLIKASDKQMKIKAKGKKDEILSAATVAVHGLLKGICDNEEHYQTFKKAVLNGIAAINYDDTADSEKLK